MVIPSGEYHNHDLHVHILLSEDHSFAPLDRFRYLSRVHNDTLPLPGAASFWLLKLKDNFGNIFSHRSFSYVQKITARKDIEVMEDLDNGKPP
ncbi:hypothetical protein HHK36_030917 [Tetracentron sinense]|uniref:Uncharacterized protein n=1 Tax=Tetracentron sinense TaxID=13715 RepID=A0A834YDM9_TETSI|nr:hypothetical protein HHK36_030917 [Tetracentron sinense]